MLKFFLIFIAIVYLIGYVGRLFLSRWLKKMQNPNNFQNNQQTVRPEGAVHINKKTSTKKHFDKQDGDYVDYEEVK
jgi:hypothetical protein